MSRVLDVVDGAALAVVTLAGAVLLSRKRRRCPHGDPERSWLIDVTWSAALAGAPVPLWVCRGCRRSFTGERHLGFYEPDGERERWRQEMARW